MDYELCRLKNELHDSDETEMGTVGNTIPLNNAKLEADQTPVKDEDSALSLKTVEPVPCSSSTMRDAKPPMPSFKNEQDLTCKYCSRTCDSAETFQNHVATHNKEKPFGCDKCNLRFKLQQSLQLHVESQHKDQRKRFVCPVCKKRYLNGKKMMLHQKIHGDPKFPCQICEKSFDSARALRLHISNAHKKRNRKSCVECHETFKNRRNLVEHLEEKHKETAKHKCEECGQTLHFKNDLITHLKTHAFETPFPCNHCHKCFSTKNGLEAHVKIHSHEKPFVCKSCYGCYATKEQLESHSLNHRPEGQFICTYCEDGPRFRTKSLLIEHLRVHAAVNPFVCNDCSESFGSRSSLCRHRKIHKRQK